MSGYDERYWEWNEKQNKIQKELLDNPPVDKFQRDIWNLEWMITEIAPGSRSWRMGRVSALRSAIKALKREEKRNGRQLNTFGKKK